MVRSAIKTVTFDSITALVEVDRSTRAVLSQYVDDPDLVAEFWRFKAIQYRMLANFVDSYGTYVETTRDALVRIYGTASAGMQTAWVNSNDRPWKAFDGDSDIVVDTL